MYNFWTLAGFEFKKLFKRKAVWLLLPLLMVFTVFSVILPSFFSSAISDSKTGQTYTLYELQQTQRRESVSIKGRLIDDSLLEETRAAQDSDETLENGLPVSVRYDGISNFILSSVGSLLKIEDSSLFTGTADELYSLRSEAIQESWEKDGLTKGEQQFLSEKEDSLEIPFQYGYNGGYNMIVSSIITVRPMLAFLIAVWIPSLFSPEPTGKTD